MLHQVKIAAGDEVAGGEAAHGAQAAQRFHEMGAGDAAFRLLAMAQAQGLAEGVLERQDHHHHQRGQAQEGGPGLVQQYAAIAEEQEQHRHQPHDVDDDLRAAIGLITRQRQEMADLVLVDVGEGQVMHESREGAGRKAAHQAVAGQGVQDLGQGLGDAAQQKQHQERRHEEAGVQVDAKMFRDVQRRPIVDGAAAGQDAQRNDAEHGQQFHHRRDNAQKGNGDDAGPLAHREGDEVADQLDLGAA